MARPPVALASHCALRGLTAPRARRGPHMHTQNDTPLNRAHLDGNLHAVPPAAVHGAAAALSDDLSGSHLGRERLAAAAAGLAADVLLQQLRGGMDREWGPKQEW